jgi:ADP-L-glycero-D-manno-heptose 6-epimerase
MIVITGAAGFIGSCLAARIYRDDLAPLMLVDDFTRGDKELNHSSLVNAARMHREEFPVWMQSHAKEISFVFHLGARTDTTESDEAIFDHLNVNYTKKIWDICTANDIPLVYASSAATYGDGSRGYMDNHDLISSLEPLNPYGWSKQKIDSWTLKQKSTPPRWYGLKFFNVYGPNEYHKGRMASVVYHAYNQVRDTDRVKLFRSHKPEYKDGWQLRDFIYVKDVVEVCLFLLKYSIPSGIYNLGTGKARSFYDLAKAVFKAMDKQAHIEFIDIPADIREAYQYFTEADMQKLTSQGFSLPFTSLEEGVSDYVKKYLSISRYM